MLALASLHLHRGELEAAQNQCVTLMRIDPGNQDASMMLADLMLQKSEWEAAIYHFQQLLEKTPAHFRALVKLLQLLRRAGRLQEASRFLKQVQLALESPFSCANADLLKYVAIEPLSISGRAFIASRCSRARISVLSRATPSVLE